MKVHRLPEVLEDGPALVAICRALRDGETRLDWSDVRRAEPAALVRLLAGVDLARMPDSLGMDTVPDAMADAIMAAATGDWPVQAEDRSETGGGSADDAAADAMAEAAEELELAPPEALPPAPIAEPQPSRAAAATSEPPLLSSPGPAALRDRLADDFERMLLGPAGGPEERLGDRPGQKYFVGTLAPLGRGPADGGGREAIDTLALGGVDTEDGTTDEDAPVSASLMPSSIGLSCTLMPGLRALRVTAKWGRYRRLKAEAAAESGEGPQGYVWQRIPAGGAVTIPVDVGPIDPIAPDPAQPSVCIRGRMRRLGDEMLVTVFLVNGQRPPQVKGKHDEAWIFQPQLALDAPDRDAVFVRRSCRTPASPTSQEAILAMNQRDSLEFATGLGAAVHVIRDRKKHPTRGVRIETRVMPRFELRPQEARGPDKTRALRRLTLDMKVLAELKPAELVRSLSALPTAYESWIDGLQQKLATGEQQLDGWRLTGERALAACDDALDRIRAGIELLARPGPALDAFRFANRVMALQRLRSEVIRARRAGRPADDATLDVPEKRSWRMFQLGFLLQNMPSAALDHPDRGDDAAADLLWFPTGGGKTEAYLGLAAYVMGLRRREGTVAGHDGHHGTAVLMRYTLRLLTLQQFQRAAALLCACEQVRQADERTWGTAPFTLGLWVGQKTTPNRTSAAAEWVRYTRDAESRLGTGAGSPAQLTSCPWCGHDIDPGRDIEVDPYPGGDGRTRLFCGSPVRGPKATGCPFTRKASGGVGLPVLVVDEEMYRQPPTLLIATVDKFALMAWRGEIQTFVGRVEQKCSRHGFRAADLKDADRHKVSHNHPAAKSTPHRPLRPPDLIIQDELHLITGPLGSLVGLYETALDALCAWSVDGRRVRPKVIASTATIRQAPSQVEGVFARSVRIFPPPGLDETDNFFSIRCDDEPGRLYLGVCAPGRRLKGAMAKVYAGLMAITWRMYQQYGQAVDPWLTLVGYFNSMRELAGARRLVEDDVRSRLRRGDQLGEVRRPPPKLEELTSRKQSRDIPELLDLLEMAFDPEVDRQRKAAKGRAKAAFPRPLDVLLATSMISVGVDVSRLGLMVVGGQPKNTAEYIQATSRVGRSKHGPGLVVTLYNWARPRDLSHYEAFEHYHATFYQHVEALSVTPFSPRALDRGLSGVLVSLVRLAVTELARHRDAESFDRNHAAVRAAVDAIVARAARVGGERASRRLVEDMLQHRLDLWAAAARPQPGRGRLGYTPRVDSETRPLLKGPESEGYAPFICPTSLRNVESTVPLVLDDRGMDHEPEETR